MKAVCGKEEERVGVRDDLAIGHIVHLGWVR